MNFGWKAENPIMYGNKRAEMWGKMKEWLKTAHLPNDRGLKDDLTGPLREPDSNGTIFLESKKKMRARGLASPDAADALAVTFAYPVANKELAKSKRDRVVSRRNGGASAHSEAWMG